MAAVNVTTWPYFEGLMEEATTVELDAWFTTWGAPESLPVLATKLVSPL